MGISSACPFPGHFPVSRFLECLILVIEILEFENEALNIRCILGYSVCDKYLAGC
jgi:hypothetical protein